MMAVVLQGDVVDRLRELPENSVHCVVTSPPYWGLRDYGVSGQLGLEPTIEEYVQKMVEIFREVRRVLRKDGVFFLNLGSSYMGSGGAHKEHHANPGISKSFERNGVCGGKNPNLSHQPQHVPACGTDGKGQSGLRENDCAYSGPDGESQGDSQNHRDRISRTCQRHHEAALQTCMRDHDTEKRDCASTSLDALLPGAQESTTPSLFDCVQAVCDHEDEALGQTSEPTYLPATHQTSHKAQNICDKSLNGQPSVRHKQDRESFSEASESPYSITDSLINAFGNVKFKQKDLLGIPWMVALALQADGWWLRADIIWAKPNPMPESVTDRPTRAHEYIFLLTKSAKYFWDQEAVREESQDTARISYIDDDGRKHYRQPWTDKKGQDKKQCLGSWASKYGSSTSPGGRNLRTVWTIATAPFPEAHFATFPPTLVEKCLKAGTSEKGVCPACGAPWVRVVEKDKNIREGPKSRGGNYGGIAKNNGTKVMQGGYEPGRHYPTTTLGFRPSCKCPNHKPIPATVLDPFLGSGTTCLVAAKMGRDSIGIELKPDYCDMAEKRLLKTKRERGLLDVIDPFIIKNNLNPSKRRTHVLDD